MSKTAQISTGVKGLDHVLCGGLPGEHVYLLEGTPGAGKTTLALSFLIEGAERGEEGLYITLSETVDELEAVASSHGWSIDKLSLFELVAENEFAEDRAQTLLHPSEVELGETVRGIIEKVEDRNPGRVVLDSLSELRLLAENPLRYRRQILALKHFFAKRNCTVLMLDDRTAEPNDLQLHSIAHGVISLEQSASDFGAERRRLRVIKMRGLKYRGGYHDFTIETGGLCVYPRLIASEHFREFDARPISSGVDALDDLLGGGLVPGTTTLLTGPAGVGKTTTAIRCLLTALERGQKASYYLFDERLATLKLRSKALGMDLTPYIENGQLDLRQIDPAELSPGEFAGAVQSAVEDDNSKLIVIDSLNAYLQAMPSDTFLILQMHELLSYLSQQGIVSIMILGQHGIMGDLRADVDISYLADTVMILRFFEARGSVRQSMAVIKTRTSDHERTIREFTIDATGINVGKPLINLVNVLGREPRFTDDDDRLIGDG